MAISRFLHGLVSLTFVVHQEPLTLEQSLCPFVKFFKMKMSNRDWLLILGIWVNFHIVPKTSFFRLLRIIHIQDLVFRLSAPSSFSTQVLKLLLGFDFHLLTLHPRARLHLSINICLRYSA